MAKIISVGRRSESEKKIGRENPLKSVWTSFQSLDRYSKFFILTALLIIVATPFIAANLLETRQRAESPTHENIATPTEEFVSNELLVKINKSSRDKIKEGKPDDTGIPSLDKINKELGVQKFERLAQTSKDSKKDAEVFAWYKVTLEGKGEKINGKLEDIIKKIDAGQVDTNNSSQAVLHTKFANLFSRFRKDDNIEAVEPNFIVHTTLTPNDPYFGSSGAWGQSYPDMWGLKKMNLESAWDLSTGSADIIVAGIDTGVDRNHEDIKDNMWVNTQEIPDNGIDDDANGYKDDYYGWNYVSNNNDPMDDHGHGTHTAGTIAATGNNGLGIVGVNWKSKIMALKFLSSSGSGTIADAIRALQYAADMGARVSSNSWGCSCTSQATDDAIKYEHYKGMVTVVAAGNDNTDANDFSPANSDYAITVAASNYMDAKSCFSNYGEKIDVSAPGGDVTRCGGPDDFIFSLKAAFGTMCTSNLKYCGARGTSMAAPHVAGLAALLLAKNPSLTNEQVRQIIRTGADDLGTAGKDSNFGYGRVNAAGSMNLINSNPLTPIITSPKSRTIIFGKAAQITGSVSGPDFSSYKIEIGAGRTPSTWKTIFNSNTQVIDGVLGSIDTTQLGEGPNIIRVTATNTAGKSYQYQVNDIELDNFDASIGSPYALAPIGQIDIVGSAQTKNGLPFVSYTVEWGQGNSPTSWSTSGISLTNGGLQPVAKGKLGGWDTSSLANGQIYTLRLNVLGAGSISTQTQVSMTLDKDIVAGWPKVLDVGSVRMSSEYSLTYSFDDIDGDGVKEIVFPGPANLMHVFRKDGTEFPGFPIVADPGYDFRFPTIVSDLDGDGKKEIITAVTDNQISLSTCRSKIYIIENDGTSSPGWPKPSLNNCFKHDSTPAVADLDGDGKKELVVFDGNSPFVDNTLLHAFRLDGTELPGFPKKMPFPSSVYNHGSPALADLDKDGKIEIIIALNQKIYLLDSQGNILPGWPYIAPEQIYAPSYTLDTEFTSTPVVGDIDGDSILEIFATGHGNGCYNCDSFIYGLKKNGALLSGWPKIAGKLMFETSVESPSVVDYNGDGKDEVISTGVPLTFFSLSTKTATSATANIRTPAIADVNGDGKVEFAFNGYTQFGIVNTLGTIIWQKNMATNVNYVSTPMLADLDNNGKMELMTFGTTTDEQYKTVFLWEIPTTNPAKYEWPMVGHNPARNGRLVLDKNNTPTPLPSTIPTPTPASGDLILPSVSVTSPLNGAVLKRNVSITITASATDNTGVSKVEFYINGALKCTDTASPYACNWKVSGKPNANYTISAKAYDLSNNSAINAVNVKTTK